MAGGEKWRQKAWTSFTHDPCCDYVMSGAAGNVLLVYLILYFRVVNVRVCVATPISLPPSLPPSSLSSPFLSQVKGFLAREEEEVQKRIRDFEKRERESFARLQQRTFTERTLLFA